MNGVCHGSTTHNLQRIAVIALFAIAILYAVGLSRGGSFYTTSLSAGILALAALSFVFWGNQWTTNYEGRVPILPTVAVIYGLYYGVPMLFADTMELRLEVISQEAAQSSVEVAFVGFCALLLGYRVVGRLGSKANFGFELAPNRAYSTGIRLVAFGAIISALSRLIAFPAAFAQPVHVLSSLLLLGLGILQSIALSGKLPTQQRAAVYLLLLPIYLLSQLSTGLVSSLIYPSVFFLSIFYSVKKKIPWLTLISLATVVLLLHSSMNEFRSKTWWSGDAGTSNVEKIVLLVKIVTNNLTGETGDRYAENAIDNMGSRTNQLNTVAWVIQQTPSFVPYWHGETYLTILTSVIPRFVWPDKPEKDLGQRFGHRYELLDATDFSTSWNFPMLAESYANFGWLGIAFIMPIIGALYRAIENALVIKNNNHGSVAVGAYALMALINIESDFSLVFGYIFQSMILIYIVFKYVNGGSKPGLSSQADSNKR